MQPQKKKEIEARMIKESFFIAMFLISNYTGKHYCCNRKKIKKHNIYVAIIATWQQAQPARHPARG